MTRAGVVLAALFLTCSTCVATVMRVATFENYAEGDSFKPSFTDPVSGITFHDSTNPTGGFVIDYSSTQFGGGNYLTAAVGPEDGLGSNFGFIGDLPAAANQISVGVTYPGFGNTSLVTLTGFDSNGATVSQQSGIASEPIPFTLQINSAQFNITRFQVHVPAGFGAGYDNISFTIAPEPSSLGLMIGSMALLTRRKACRTMED